MNGENDVQLRDKLYGRIRDAANNGTLSHAFIISGKGDTVSAARYLAAAMECTAAGQKPCMKCNACRKVAENIHPDVITAFDAEHKVMSADYARSLRSDAYIMPNEGNKKVYIFTDASQLDSRDQDIMLKTVEEGPPYSAFIFCTENASALLGTICSRCIELKLTEVEAELSVRGEALELCDRIIDGDEAAMMSFLGTMETKKMKRDALYPMLDDARSICTAALLTYYGRKPSEIYEKRPEKLSESLTKRQLAGIIEMLEIYRDGSRFNVSVGQTLGALGVALLQVIEK